MPTKNWKQPADDVDFRWYGRWLEATGCELEIRFAGFQGKLSDFIRKLN